jgi:hypothetical protein
LAGGNGGNGGNGFGGSLYIAGGDVQIIDAVFSDDQAIGGLGEAGGLGGSGNHQVTGGANGTAGTNGQGIGGAIYIEGGSVAISRKTTFDHNQASTSDPDVFGSYTTL